MKNLNLYSQKELETIKFEDWGLKNYFFFKKPWEFIHEHGKNTVENKRRILSIQNIIDLFINNLMRKKYKTGKKEKNYRYLKEVFDEFRKKGENPLQIFVKAIENSAPKEGYFKIYLRGGNVIKSVDYSPTKRMDISIRNITKSISKIKFKNNTSIVKIIQEELENASKNNLKSKGISKKEEIEKIGKTSR